MGSPPGSWGGDQLASKFLTVSKSPIAHSRVAWEVLLTTGLTWRPPVASEATLSILSQQGTNFHSYWNLRIAKWLSALVSVVGVEVYFCGRVLVQQAFSLGLSLQHPEKNCKDCKTGFKKKVSTVNWSIYKTHTLEAEIKLGTKQRLIVSTIHKVPILPLNPAASACLYIPRKK